MSTTRPSPVRPLIVGALIGFILGLLLGLGGGLFYAWVVNPATYAGGAFPNELREDFQAYYVNAVTDEYLRTNDTSAIRSRLSTFSVEQKVRSLALAASSYQQAGRTVEFQRVSDLAASLSDEENWDANAIASGLEQAASQPGVNQAAVTEFGSQLGHVPSPPSPATSPTPAGQPSEPGRISPILLFCLALALVLLAGVILLILLRRRRARTAAEEPAPFAADWDGTGPQPLRQWVGTFNIGDDNYDESFTVETTEGDFLGECGMGILEFAPDSSPKQVWAFDVWLFDKTDIRTISKVLISEQAHNDPEKREKVSPKGEVIVAQVGTTFEIDTTALNVKADIEEATVDPNGHFNAIKVRLSAYLKPGVDIGGDMPIPDTLGG
ncbi:MAG: hypothetical protein ACE5H9_17390 [Anaerolineae bacterium]